MYTTLDEASSPGSIGRDDRPRLKWRRILMATTAALSLGVQDAAWAVCSDGSTFPQNGYVVGQAPLQGGAANWSHNVFTATAGSVWVPDSSTNEFNDPSQPLTGGGHNWVFDQGSTLCKETDTGPAGGWPPHGQSRRTPRPPASYCRSSKAAGSPTSATFPTRVT